MPAAGNAEETKRRILDAALDEFSTHGIAGARVDRIAKTADCNKNLIYVYFTNKEQLLSAVLQEHLPQIYDELAFDADNLAEFAGRVFDYAQANPQLMRLIAWSALDAPAGGVPARREARTAKVTEIRAAQKRGVVSDRYSPGFLLTMTMSLATAWSALSPFAPTLPRATKKELDAMRQGVVRTIDEATKPQRGQHQSAKR